MIFLTLFNHIDNNQDVICHVTLNRAQGSSVQLKTIVVDVDWTIIFWISLRILKHCAWNERIFLLVCMMTPWVGHANAKDVPRSHSKSGCGFYLSPHTLSIWVMNVINVSARIQSVFYNVGPNQEKLGIVRKSIIQEICNINWFLS